MTHGTRWTPPAGRGWPPPARPSARVDVRVAGDRVTLDGAPSSGIDGPIRAFRWSERPGNPAPLGLASAAGERLELTAPSTPGEYFVTLEVADAEGRRDRSTAVFAVEPSGPRPVDLSREAPAWAAAAVVYGVVPPLFGERPFRDVAARLEELRELGVNALWLSPITVSPEGDFGYAVTDYFDTNPRYGTLAEFRALVERAHGLGIRVLIDFVPNHTSDQHPFFLEAQREGGRSPYFAFYDRDENGEPTHYFDWTNLPNLNFSNPAVERFMTEAFTFWVRELDVDGFRVDACWGVRLRRPDYWPRWRAELKRVKPDLLLIAEATARDPWYLEHGFDVGYDWTDELGQWAWQDVFGDPATLPGKLAAALAADPEPGRVLHFLNNNDTATRFVTTHGPAATRVAAALLLTLPGIPCVYTGEEIGAEYLPYAYEGPLDWNADPHGLRGWYATLIRLRTATPSLHSPAWTPLRPATAGGGVVAYLRHAPDGAEPLLVLLNFASGPRDVELDVPGAFPAVAGAARFRDLVSGQAVTPDPGSPRSIHMQGASALVLAPEGGAP